MSMQLEVPSIENHASLMDALAGARLNVLADALAKAGPEEREAVVAAALDQLRREFTDVIVAMTRSAISSYDAGWLIGRLAGDQLAAALPGSLAPEELAEAFGDGLSARLDEIKHEVSK